MMLGTHIITILLTLICCALFANLLTNVDSCPYYDVSDECYARLDAMIGTMNEQYKHFIVG